MIIGVLITIGDQKLFEKKTNIVTIEQKCTHYDDSMVDFNYCPYCSDSLSSIKKTVTNIESNVEGFIDDETYKFGKMQYCVSRDEENHKKAKEYFIVVQYLGYNPNADDCIKALQIAKKISRKLNKSNINSIATISHFKHWTSYD